MNLITKSYSGKLLACLSGSAIALLPMVSLAAPAASPAAACPSGVCEKGERARPTADAAQRTVLGVLLQPMSPELAAAFGLKNNTGALIAQVMPKSPAAQAGLKQGDVITAVDGQEIADGAALQKHIAAQAGGTKVEIQYLRDAEKRTAQAELAGPAAEKERSVKADADKTLGMKVADLDDRLRAELKLPENLTGAVVTAIAEDSAADRAGLRVGDVLQQIDRKDVTDAASAAALSKAAQDKDKVVVLVWSRGAARFALLDRSA